MASMEQTTAAPERTGAAGLREESHTAAERTAAAPLAARQGQTGPPRFSRAWIDQVVGYHTPDDLALDQVDKSTRIRAATSVLMEAIIENCPDSADRSAALRHARDAMMTANASIVLNGLV